MADAQKMYKPEEVKPAVIASLEASFPYETRGMLEQIADAKIGGWANPVLARFGAIDEERLNMVIGLSECEIYLPKCESLMAKLGIELIAERTNVSREDASDFVVSSYFAVERYEPDETKPETLPRGIVRRQVIGASPEKFKADFKSGVESGDIIGGWGFIDLVSTMRHFDRLPGYVNAGLYDSDAAFRVISDPANYAAKIYEKDVERIKGIFDKCDFSMLSVTDILSLMRTMEDIMSGELNPIVTVSSMGHRISVKTPAPKRDSCRPKTAADLAEMLNKAAENFASGETEIIDE